MNLGTAIAQTVGKAFDFFSLGKQRKIVKEQGKNIDKLTRQERIRYNQLISAGNNELAARMLQIAGQRDSGKQTTTIVIVSGVVLAIVLITVLKARK